MNQLHELKCTLFSQHDWGFYQCFFFFFFLFQFLLTQGSGQWSDHMVGQEGTLDMSPIIRLPMWGKPCGNESEGCNEAGQDPIRTSSRFGR